MVVDKFANGITTRHQPIIGCNLLIQLLLLVVSAAADPEGQLCCCVGRGTTRVVRWSDHDRSSARSYI